MEYISIKAGTQLYEYEWSEVQTMLGHRDVILVLIFGSEQSETIFFLPTPWFFVFTVITHQMFDVPPLCFTQPEHWEECVGDCIRTHDRISHRWASCSLTLLTYLWFKSGGDTRSFYPVFHPLLAWSHSPPLSRLYKQTKDPLGGKLWRGVSEEKAGVCHRLKLIWLGIRSPTQLGSQI